MATRFKYEFTLSCENTPKDFSLSAIFPAVTDITFVSTSFTDLVSCLKSCKQLIDDTLNELNELNEIFESYLHTKQTLEKLPEDWNDTEVARYVILKKPEKNEDGVLLAENIFISQARIFQIEEDVLIH